MNKQSVDTERLKRLTDIHGFPIRMEIPDGVKIEDVVRNLGRERLESLHDLMTILHNQDEYPAPGMTDVAPAPGHHIETFWITR
ncbi:hypothetical protein A6M27_13110 [Acidithiobacillus thiooxidans]|uniref:Uncharacterized protein n=1 Tax=Acidithiobacillus thiooxidans TaxID=930 RepID=A0A1C2HX16_ACITH|nr:hypothetical protein [Acidithiobacillus thiooxidans]OCX68254.1 hypothetical protein A6P07_18705 [Acidithiobacillus thiooxidans]OCX75813.1 hypothetical protein A6O24_09540 [Acidithiobacillus thiooxidans]OCX79548.1 hypothetical protein A6O26_16500 [Acidithiobacillus thiooxidans]OCX86317.1 hypothetical protein A6M27_13110 [Acidithiobacillus thiooxidans]OFC51215.1 hypothetical protein BAE47_00245 [Acidithiobacillus thiooxidans]